jgi:hypothetical protein
MAVHVRPLAVSAIAFSVAQSPTISRFEISRAVWPTELVRRLIQILLLLAFGHDRSSCLLRTLRLHSMRRDRGFGHLEFCAHAERANNQ